MLSRLAILLLALTISLWSIPVVSSVAVADCDNCPAPSSPP